MLDVLLDLRLASYRGGGIARYARELHAALASLPDIHVTALRTRRDATTDATALRIRTPPHHRLESWSIPIEIGFSRNRYDMFHATDFIAPHVRGVPSVATVHDLAYIDWPDDLAPDALRYYRQLERSKERTAAWIAPSEWTANSLVEHYRIPRDTIHVIPHGVPTDLYSQTIVPRSDRGNYLLAVGTVEPRKRYDLLLDALAIDPSLPRLIIAGATGWNATATEHRLRSMQRVTRETGVSDERLRELYRTALALVFPSRAEGFGLPALEAMASGTPVISSGGGALIEVTATAALTVADPAPESWATAMRKLVDDPLCWQELSDAGRDQAALFSWQSSARLTAAVYHSIARR